MKYEQGSLGKNGKDVGLVDNKKSWKKLVIECKEGFAKTQFRYWNQT